MACADCFTGSVHEGQPRGTTTNVYGLNAYVVEPTDGRPTRGIIVITPDAFGWEFVNNRILADHYADKGDYKVYIPDFMKGMCFHPLCFHSLKGHGVDLCFHVCFLKL